MEMLIVGRLRRVWLLRGKCTVLSACSKGRVRGKQDQSKLSTLMCCYVVTSTVNVYDPYSILRWPPPPLSPSYHPRMQDSRYFGRGQKCQFLRPGNLERRSDHAKNTLWPLPYPPIQIPPRSAARRSRLPVTKNSAYFLSMDILVWISQKYKKFVYYRCITFAVLHYSVESAHSTEGILVRWEALTRTMKWNSCRPLLSGTLFNT